MKIVQTFANNAFLKHWQSDRGILFNLSLPKTLMEEVETLTVLRDSLLMQPQQRTQGEFDSIFRTDPTVSRVEYSLNKRHLIDYTGDEKFSLTEVVDLFGSFAISVRCKSNCIGVNDKLTFMLSLLLFEQFNDHVEADPVFTFYRHVKGGHILDFAKLDEFELHQILVFEL